MPTLPTKLHFPLGVPAAVEALNSRAGSLSIPVKCLCLPSCESSGGPAHPHPSGTFLPPPPQPCAGTATVRMGRPSPEGLAWIPAHLISIAQGLAVDQRALGGTKFGSRKWISKMVLARVQQRLGFLECGACSLGSPCLCLSLGP